MIKTATVDIVSSSIFMYDMIENTNTAVKALPLFKKDLKEQGCIYKESMWKGEVYIVKQLRLYGSVP